MNHGLLRLQEELRVLKDTQSLLRRDPAVSGEADPLRLLRQLTVEISQTEAAILVLNIAFPATPTQPFGSWGGDMSEPLHA